MTDEVLRRKRVSADPDERRWQTLLARVDDLEARLAAQERRWVYRKRKELARNWRDQAILNAHGLMKLTLEDIGQVFGMTRERVRQIIKAGKETPPDAVSGDHQRGPDEGEGAAG